MRKTHDNHTRRVNSAPEEDVWVRLEREAEAESYGADGLGLLERGNGAEEKNKKRRKKRRKKPPEADKDKEKDKEKDKKKEERDISARSVRERHQMSQKKQRMFIARMRALAALIAAVIIISAVLFLTPFFDVKNISVSGNTIVSAEQVSELIGSVKGTNLFLAGKSGMEKKLKTIKYVKDVQIKKSVFPPEINISLTEHIPAGYVQSGSEYLLMDKNLYIIDSAGGFDLNTIPCIIGMKISKSELGRELVPENEEVGKSVRIFLSVMQQDGGIPGVVSADFSNMNEITFNYQNRITAMCGSQTDLDRKLRLFCETVKNENIAPDAVGTIDLSTAGRAIYTP